MGFAFQYDDAVKSMFKSGIPKYLDPNRRPLDGETYSFYKHMREFPSRATNKKWLERQNQEGINPCSAIE